MEALTLDPNGYAGTYKLIGGRLALDFINTISWPDTGRSHDWFSKAENVEGWLAAVGLEPRSASAADRDEIVGLRDVISVVIRPLAHGDHPPATTVSALNDVVRSTAQRRRVDPETLQWSWAPAQRTIELFDPVVLEKIRVSTGETNSPGRILLTRGTASLEGIVWLAQPLGSGPVTIELFGDGRNACSECRVERKDAAKKTCDSCGYASARSTVQCLPGMRFQFQNLAAGDA